MNSGSDSSLTWAALLGRWMDFAKASLAIPPGDEGDGWRRSVSPIIALQALTSALSEIADLDPDERALGLDKADLLVARHIGEVNEAWAGRDMPDSVLEVVDDARAALHAAVRGGVELILEDEALEAPHPGQLVNDLIEGGFDGDLLVPVPGRRLFRGCPVAFVRPARGGLVSDAILSHLATFLDAEVSGQDVPDARQVYRQFDFAQGRAVRDLVAPMSADLPPGQPLLVWAIEGGQSQPVTLPGRLVEPEKPLELVIEGESAGA